MKKILGFVALLLIWGCGDIPQRSLNETKHAFNGKETKPYGYFIGLFLTNEIVDSIVSDSLAKVYPPLMDGKYSFQKGYLTFKNGILREVYYTEINDSTTVEGERGLLVRRNIYDEQGNQRELHEISISSTTNGGLISNITEIQYFDIESNLEKKIRTITIPSVKQKGGYIKNVVTFDKNDAEIEWHEETL